MVKNFENLKTLLRYAHSIIKEDKRVIGIGLKLTGLNQI